MSARPAATMFFATKRAAYAAERSTFVQSLPEKAPPPCLAYAARFVAKNIVAAGLADKCEIQLSYAIGVAHPTSISVDTFGTGKKSEEELIEIINKNFDLTPNGIIKMLDLRRPIYKQTAAYGHFGRNDIEVPWEEIIELEY